MQQQEDFSGTQQADVDRRWMDHALGLARRAEAAGEVPVGAVVVADGQLIAKGWNQPIGRHDVTAHAEIVALRAACRAQGNYRLPGHTLYVTLEPCLMCAGAIIHARIQRVVYATTDPRAGAVVSVLQAFDTAGLNHRVAHAGGTRAQTAADMLRAFFRARRT